MSNPEVVFARFVEANPVPDAAAVHESIPDLGKLLSGLPDRSASAPAPALSTPRRKLWVVAVATFVVVLAVGGLWLSLARGSADPEPAVPPDPLESLRRDAAVSVERWLAAVNQGDIESVMGMSSSVTRTIADERLHGWVAGFAASGLPVEVASCDVVSVVNAGAEVRCEILLADPVAVELDVAAQVAPFHYRDGLVAWRPYEGGDISLVNAAYAEYLRQFQRSEYEAVCSPAAYRPGSVVQDRSLALTGACAGLAAPLADRVVQWIQSGRPSP